MSIPIATIRPPSQIPSIDLPSTAKSAPPAADFQSVLGDAIGKMQQVQSSADAVVNRFLTGENEEVHQIALQTQQSELQFEMFMAVRNKVVSAYQEVMKMQM
jgi:flagellar hook-basal body complex protein FliE